MIVNYELWRIRTDSYYPAIHCKAKGTERAMRSNTRKELENLSRDLEQHQRDLDSARYIAIGLCKALDLSRSEVEKAMRLAAACHSEQELQNVIRHLIVLGGEEAEDVKEKVQSVIGQAPYDIEQLREAIGGILELLVQKGMISAEEVQGVSSLEAFLPER